MASNKERNDLLHEYAVLSRAFADAAERLYRADTDVELFIRTLDETGTARRACEKGWKRLNAMLTANSGRVGGNG